MLEGDAFWRREGNDFQRARARARRYNLSWRATWRRLIEVTLRKDNAAGDRRRRRAINSAAIISSAAFGKWKMVSRFLPPSFEAGP